MTTRRFECVDDKSSKFWEISVSGVTTTVKFGKIGSHGQTKSKDHGDAAKANKFAEKEIASKLKGGYTEVSGAAQKRTQSASAPSAVGFVELEDGAAYPRFDLKELSFTFEDGERMYLLFDSIDPSQAKKKGKKKDEDEEDDEEDEEEDEDDWRSRVAWDNYGPNFSMSEGYLEAATSDAFENMTFPCTVKIANPESFMIHCCDHQETCDNVIVFEREEPDGSLVIDWTGKIKMDSDEEHPHGFRLRGTAKKRV
jgi:predicted DNA-binding WGR domain protein